MRIMDAKPEAFVAQLRCDRCGVEAQYNVDDGFNNFVQIGFDAAWGSDLGDGNRIDVDLCHTCLKATLGAWLRVSPSASNTPISARPGAGSGSCPLRVFADSGATPTDDLRSCASLASVLDTLRRRSANPSASVPVLDFGLGSGEAYTCIRPALRWHCSMPTQPPGPRVGRLSVTTTRTRMATAERELEDELIAKLQELKYSYREDTFAPATMFSEALVHFGLDAANIVARYTVAPT